jgi:hypothetical protein
MPPEQAMGGEVTPRADLYSLGAMLYEMVCGRPPFLGDDNIAIIGQHINTPPVAPTWHRSDCPRPLEALILRLLSKNPTERPENASDVLAALEAVDVSPSEQSITEPEEAVNVLDSLAGDVFVGRQREMDELKAALEDALGGRGRMVTLVGEPGIGKTRTATELATYAGLRGCQVLWGRCYEEQGVPPYWPWVQAIRSYVRDRDPEDISSEMGSAAGVIAEVVSDVRDRLPGLPRPAQIDDPESARFRLFDSITAFLKTASQRQPLVMILDDLHWSDKPTLMLLQFIVRELTGARLLLIGTYRDVELNRRHPLSEALGDLTRERLFERVLLRGLSHDDVDRFIEVTSGITPPSSLVDAVHTQTEGNPLFVTEVVRLLVQEGELSSDESTVNRESWTVRIPEGVREVIGRRLNQLSARCNGVLTVASVVGREFDLQQMDALTDDLTEDMLLDVLEEGLDARVIEELPTAVGLYQFTHALIQETLTEELSLTRRVRLHARIAETLERMYESEIERHAAELALHFAQAETMLGADRLAKYSLMAGNTALENLAYEDALELFERAQTALENRPDDILMADALAGVGKAQLAALADIEYPVALRNFIRAFDIYVAHENVARAIEVASISFFVAPGWLQEAEGMLKRALSLAPPDSVQEGRIQSRYAMVRGREFSDLPSAEKALARAEEIAGNHNDADLHLFNLSNRIRIYMHHRKHEDAMSAGRELIELSKNSGDKHLIYYGHSDNVLGYIYTGAPDRAREHLRISMELAENLGQHSYIVSSLVAGVNLAANLGDWDDVMTLTERATAMSPGDGRALVVCAIAVGQIGDADDVKNYTDRMPEIQEQQQRLGLSTASATSRTARVAGNIAYIFNDDSCLDEVSQWADEAFADPVQSVGEYLIAATGMAFAMAASNSYEDAGRYYEIIKPHRGSVSDYVQLDRVLGLLARGMGRHETAAAHFEDAIAFCRRAGYLPDLAWSLCEYAEMLLESDLDRATAMLDEALRISTDLGMRPLMERILSKRDILKA